jgi:hypothetical protein
MFSGTDDIMSSQDASGTQFPPPQAEILEEVFGLVISVDVNEINRLGSEEVVSFLAREFKDSSLILETLTSDGFILLSVFVTSWIFRIVSR